MHICTYLHTEHFAILKQPNRREVFMKQWWVEDVVATGSS